MRIAHVAALVFALGGLSSCGVDPNKAERILASNGLSDVKIGGFAVWGCSKDDQFRSSFSARDKSGNLVTGVVCGGWLKGYTVRYD